MQPRRVSHYLANVLAEIIVKQDTEEGMANAAKLKEALRARAGGGAGGEARRG